MRGMSISRISHSKNKHLYALSGLLFLGIIGTYAFAFGTVTKSENPANSTANSFDDNSSLPGLATPVSKDAAQKIAQAQKPGSTVEKVEAISGHGTITTYNVHFTDGTKVQIAADGAVMDTTEPETNPQADSPKGEPTTSSEPATTSPEPTTPSENTEEENNVVVPGGTDGEINNPDESL